MRKIFLKNKNKKGYAILFTIIIVSAISVITAGLSNTAYKQLILSSLAKDSQLAFYQSDTATDCSLYADKVEGTKLPIESNIISTGGPWSCGGADLIVTPTGNGYRIYPVDEDSSSPCFRIDVDKTSIAPSYAWQSGLVSWWKFDGDASDSVGPNNGTVNGATSTNIDCKSGQCYNFDGIDDNINVGNDVSLRTFSEITLATWVKFESIDYAGGSGNLMSFAAKGNVDDGGSPHSAFWFSYDNRGDGDTFSYCAFGNTSGGYNGGGNNFGSVSYTFNNDVWYQIAVTIDSLGQGRLFVNGSQIGPTEQFNDLDLSNAVNPLLIGENIYGYNFDGSLDEMMIWNRALSSLEVQEVYDSFGPSSGGLVSTTIQAKGYNICNMNNPRTVEREIEIKYEE